MTPARLAALALVVATNASAQTYSIGASLSGGLYRTDSWSAAQHAGVTSLDAGAEANFSGTPLRPGLLQLLASGRFRTLHTIYDQGNTTNLMWGFGLRLAGLSETFLPIQLFASRDWSDFFSNLSAQQTGSTIVTSFGGSTQFILRGFPTVRLSLFRNILENTSFGGPPTTAGTTSLSVGASYSIGTQTYDASYDTAWNTGTWAQNNYHTHSVGVSVSAEPFEKIFFRLSDRYYLRLPLNVDPSNPRWDDNLFSVGISRPVPGLATSADYEYRHLLVSAPGTPDAEQSVHHLGVQASYHFSPNVDVQGNAGAAFTDDRLGAVSAGGANENLGGGLTWRSDLGSHWSLNGGGGFALGATEPTTGGFLFAYGFNTSAGIHRAGEHWRGNANYSISFNDNLDGAIGWALLQQASLTTETNWKGIGGRVTLLATDARRTNSLFGTSIGQSISLSLSLAWKRYEGTLSGGLSNGAALAITGPNPTTGVFIPTTLNTVTRFATLTLSTNFDNGRLVLRAIGRALSTSSPGRPDQFEYGASALASYAIGAFVFSLEERYSFGGMGTTTQHGNQIMLRVSRSFGWTF